MQLDERAYNFIKKAKTAGYTLDQVANFLRDKGYEFEYTPETKQTSQENQTPEQPEQEQPQTKGPGLIEGFGQKAGNAFAFGQGSRIAGVTNTGAGRVLMQTINPIGSLLAPKPTLEELNPAKYAEQYQQGKQQFEQQSAQYEKEHPTASMIAEGAGTVAGFLLPAGAVGRGAAGAAGSLLRLNKAGKLGMIAQRAIGEATAGALYEGVREGFGEGRADAEAAVQGAKKGTALFGALGILGGGAKLAEESLLGTAEQLVKNPASNKLLKALASQIVKHPNAAGTAATIGGIAAEGAVLGAVPSYLNDQEITRKDIAEGLAWAAGGRAAAEGLAIAGRGFRKLATEPTAMQVEEMKEKAKQAKSLGRKQERANVLRSQLEEVRTSIKEIGQSFEQSVQEDTALFSKLEDGAEAVKAVADEGGWKVVKDHTSKTGESRYITLEKEGKTKKVRISAHEGADTEVDFNLDLRKKGAKSIEELATSLGAGEKTASELTKVEKRITRQIGEMKGGVKGEYKVSATKEEIAGFMKEHASNPNMTEEKAARILQTQKTEAALRSGEKSRLPFKERMLRGIKSAASKVMTEFNLMRPIENAMTDLKAVAGEEVRGAENPVYTLSTLRNGGKQEALLAPVYDTIKETENKFKGSVQGANELLQAEKKIQFAKDAGEKIDSEALRTIEMYKEDAPVQKIANEMRKLNQYALDRLYESGRIDKATYEKWKKNDAYVPSWAERFEEDGEQIIANHTESFLKKYGGKAAVYENAVLSSMGQAKYIDQFAELQKAKKQYLKIAEKTGKAINVTPSGEYKGGPVKFNREKEIVVWENGKPQVWQVPEKVAEYFNPVKPGPDSLPVKVAKALFGFPMQLYKGGTTAVSLGFSQNNIVRDVQGAVIGSEHGAYIGPDMIRSSMGELIKNEPIAQELHKQIGTQTLRDVEQLPGLAKDKVKEFSDMYAAIDKAGGEGTQRGFIARMFTTALPKAARKASSVSSKATTATLDAMSYAGQLGEETTRLSVFKSELKAAARDKAQYEAWLARPDTIPADLKAKAGNAAREVTLNFRRQMAPWVEFSNKYMLPYFKPSILGAMRGFEVLTNPEIAPKAWRAILDIGMLQGLINGKIGDKKQLEDLEAYNNEMSGKNFLFKNKAGQLLTIPLAQEFSPLIKLVSGVTEKLYRRGTKQQREDVAREMNWATKQLLENYVPGVGYFTEPSNLVIGQIPKAVVEEWVNRDIFSGTPIVSEYMKDKPSSMQYTKSTPQTLVQASSWLAKHGVEISPMRLNHIAKSFGSNTAKEMLAATDAVLSANGIGELRPKKEVTDNPLVRRFVANITAPYNQYNQDANSIINANKGGYNVIKKKEFVGLPKQQVDRYMDQYLLYKRAENSINNLNELRQKRAKIERKIAFLGKVMRDEYEKGNMSKEEYMQQREQALNTFNSILDTQTQLERQFQMEIIKTAKEEKEYRKKNPR